MSRFEIIILAFVATASLFVGCGGNGHAPVDGAAEVRPLPRQTQVTEYAEAVNLRAADAPTMTSISIEGKTVANMFATEVTRCGGGFPGWEAGTIHSVKLQQIQEREIVMSAVHVMPSAAIARKNFAANLSTPVRTCIGGVFGAHSPDGPLVRKHAIVSTFLVPLPRDGTEKNSFGIRIAVSVSYKSAAGKRAGVSFGNNAFEDILGFAYGSSEIVLIDTHGPRALLSPTELRLLLLLYNRAHQYAKILNQ